MKKTLSTLLCAAALGLAVCGCQDTVNTIENRDKHAQPASIAGRRFVTDSFLKNRLAVTSMRTATAPSGHLTVEVAVRNTRTGFFPELWSHVTGENPYPVSYKFDWQDANGMQVHSQISGIWQRITIYPGEAAYFRATAPTPECKDFVLSVKECNNK